MEWYHMCVTVWFWQTGTQTSRENMKKNEKQAYWHSDPNKKRKAALTHIKPTRRRIGMMFCPPASSRAHVTLIQSFSFNFKSLADFRNPHWVHWKSPALLLSSSLPPFVFFFIPPFIFYVISLFLPLISSRRNLRVVCGSYHSVAPSACRSIRPSARLPLPRSQLVFFFVLFWGFLPFRNSSDDGSEFCCSHKKYHLILQVKIQIPDSGTTSLHAVAFDNLCFVFFLAWKIRFTVWGFFFTVSVLQIFVFYW